MTVFYGYVVLRGLNDKTLRKVYDMGDFTQVAPGDRYVAAQSALSQIVGALENVCDAGIVETGLTSVETSPAEVGAGDLFENGMVNVWSLDEDDPTAVQHIAQVYIPAASGGIFQATTGLQRDVIDVNDAALQQYIDQLAQHAYISDGETIQTAVGVAGMIDGKRVIRKARLGR